MMGTQTCHKASEKEDMGHPSERLMLFDIGSGNCTKTGAVSRHAHLRSLIKTSRSSPCASIPTAKTC